VHDGGRSRPHDPLHRPRDASIKYLLLGAFASALFLYGAALIYGATGSIDYRGFSSAVFEIYDKKKQVDSMVLLDQVEMEMVQMRHGTLFVGVLMLLAGLFFKVAAVPFHMWTPDVYEGAPTPITAYMATGVKVAAFAGLVRLVIFAFIGLWGETILYNLIYVLAVLTMTLGNFVAIAQKNLKRMLAYSSIAHAGYLLVGITAVFASTQFAKYGGGTDGNLTVIYRGLSASSSILFYLMAYTFMNLGAFGVIAVVSRDKKQGDTLDGFSGLAGRRPAPAAVMAICMLSLAGVPPLAGFAAKFYVFQAAVGCHLYYLAVIGVLNSVVSAYYYLRVIVVMYMEPQKGAREERQRELVSGASLANVLMAAIVVAMGMFPRVVLKLISKVFSAEMIDLVVH
jgi:NADH-quinone oxidoreductase subunit N